MKERTFPFLLCVALVAFNACERLKPAATGAEDEILVFADADTWQALEQTLRETFEDTVFTPQPERWFQLVYKTAEEMGQWETHKNRIIVAPLDGTGPVADYVRTALEPRVKALVEEGKETHFVKYDSRARQQILLFLTAPTTATLNTAIRNHAPDLLYYFRAMTLRRELASIAADARYHKKDIEKRLLDHYGWTMTVQHDYWVARDSAEARFFWIRRATPADMERWIFVHWFETDRPDILTDRFVLTLRDSLTRQFLRTIDDSAHVEIAPYHLEVQAVNFLGRFAYEVRGNWRFSDLSGGGPFVSYAFYDERTRRVYFLDGSIFAPRVEKKKLINQVDGLLHTFKTVNDASP